MTYFYYVVLPPIPATTNFTVSSPLQKKKRYNKRQKTRYIRIFRTKKITNKSAPRFRFF
nr:orf36 [Trichoplusia ni single nucleopolyhedrovirus]